VLNQHIFRVIPDEQKIDKRYLRYALDRALSQMQRHLHGATMQHVNRGQFLSTKLFTPSITEQRRIANILDSVDVLRAKRRDALAQLGTLTQSMFFDMFGDPATNPKAWPEVSLGEVITNGPQNGLYKPSSSYGSGTPILRIDAFYDGEVTNLRSLKRVEISAPERERYGLQNGNIVINRVNSREYLGKSALIRDLKEATVFESNIMRFNVNARLLAPDYLISLLQTQHVYAQIQRRAKDAVNQSSINQYDVKAMQLVVPPLWLQETFVLRKLAAAKHAQALQLSLSGVDALFASLQHRAFRGEL
jgi:type I restriction enzyme S subunit